ncbi:MAG: hypothetical protein V2A72_03800 [Candidatus Omnitrophota bacterium]
MMDNTAIKRLCLNLANARSEEDVARAIDKHPVLSNQGNWRHYGDAANNLGTVTGQSPQAVPSLIEKITNSIDAILIKACFQKGEHPEGPNAPKSMEEALERYFGINDAAYTDLTDPKRRELASNIQIIAEESKTAPNICIYDNGEGQHPQNFPNTLVSLNKKNKIKIFFVQGKYNMGGTAVLPFCGNNRYQLIISRKNLLDDNQPFGFTLVRRNRGTGESVRASWYEYCINADGKIFEFTSQPLDLNLSGRKFAGGTYIKLFNYDLRNPSDITLDLWRELNRYLYKPALPVLLYETRYRASHSPTKIMHGNRMRCFLDSRDSVENIFTAKIKSDNVEYPIEVFVFKKELEPREFIRDMALVFSVNGQVQHSIDNRFVSQDLKKAYLKGHLLVSVDCSAMPRELHEDIFMSSRSQMRDKVEYRNLIDNITKELKDNDYLTSLDERWRKEQIFANPKDEKFLKSIVGKLLRDDKEIEKLLGLAGGVIGRELTKVKKEIETKKEKFTGKRYPTYFQFKNLKPGDIKMLPQNGECKINIETDVENEYLIRPHDKGELKIKVLRPYTGKGPGPVGPGGDYEEVLDVNVVGPNEGDIKLRIKPKKELPIGTKVPINIEMSSPDGLHRLIADIVIDKPHGEFREEEVDKKKEYSLPKLIEVYKEKNEEDKEDNYKCWENYNWYETDICYLHESSQEGCLIDAIAINMNSLELDKFIRARKVIGKQIEIVQRTYKTAVYLLSLVFYYELYQRLKKEESLNKYSDEKMQFEPSELVSYTMKGLAKILLHILANETLLQEIETIEAS